MTFVKDLDKPLLRISRKADFYTPRNSFSSMHIWGLIGGGKTTSGKMFAGAYLRGGYGGYVNCVKNDEVELWLRYLREHGRSNSLVLFDDGEGFNFLQYEMSKHGFDGINTVVESIMHIVDTCRLISGGSSRGGEAFWSDAPRQPLRNGLPVLYSATGSLSIPDILRFITTAPTTPQETANPEWQKRSFMNDIMNRAVNHPTIPISNSALQNAITYWAEQWPAIPDKTRGNIVITLTAALDRFNHGRLNRVFCGKTTVVPEMCFGGAVIVDAKPTLVWNEDGIIAQRLFKYFWQRAVLSRRSLAEQHRERPLFHWSDESQETVLPTDEAFLGLARQSKCAITYLSQSLPTYFSRMGGDNPRDSALSLAGKFGNHVFCANGCPETNEFASRMLGKIVTRRRNVSNGSSQSVNLGMSEGSSMNSGSSSNSGSSHSFAGGHNTSFNSGGGHTSGSGNNWGSNRGRGTTENISHGYSESLEYAIDSGDFARYLKTGGPQNGNRVTAVWFQTARKFKATGTNYLIVEFAQ